ncbi:MAG: family 78 glycoside hydrolase catalytic domain, partial [Burkholderiaceae bacterium]|nr:family 78 glycoside hydrolase catalytic domain [Burkholderiaceae bacterium]
DMATPQISWQLTSSQKRQKQTAYQVLVSDQEVSLGQDKGNFWDSGMVRSSETGNIPYRGKPLSSGLKLFWKVRIWDSAGNPSAWSQPGQWEMGYLNKSDWQARRFGTGEDLFPDSVLTGPAPFFRKTVSVPSVVRSARVSVCGLGFYELYLNGVKVGDQVLAPAQTNYDVRKLKKLLYFHDDQSRQRVLYNTFDVTSLIKSGENAIGMVLGNGWFNQRDRTEEGRLWYTTPRLIFQMEITFRDGSKKIVCSDKTWKVTTGPILHDAIFTGEWYDARLELGDWSKPGFNDQKWQKASEVRAPSGQLQSQLAPFDKVVRSVRPVYLKQNDKVTHTFDTGEMISGWVRIRLHGQKGDTVRIRHIEELGSDYNQIDTYILKGLGEEIYEPRFTWHSFRQVEIRGLRYRPESRDIEVRVVHTDVEPAGEFICSNPLFNKIAENYIRTQLGNLHGSISSDCPHRERLGYTGDGQVAVEAAIFNFDMTRFYQKWFLDMEDARNHNTGYVPHTVPFGGGGGGPAWGSGYVIMPWAYFLYYGDKNVLQTHYDGMSKWVEYLGTRCDTAGIVVREEPKGWCLGDWATPVKIKLSPELVNTCYYYYVTDLMSKVAGVLGKTADQRRFARLTVQIGYNINRKFYSPITGEYLDGKQGANLFPLAFGITPENQKQRVFSNVLKHLEINKYHFDTGILGTPLLLKVLTENGREDLAYTVMNQRDFPSYGNYILGRQATTIWENWDGGSSHSHPMYGSVVAWFYNTVAGISPDNKNPGWKSFTVSPFTDNELTYATATYRSANGKISSSWRKEQQDLIMSVEIPVNSTATIHFPTKYPVNITEEGLPVLNSKEFKYLGIQNGKSLFLAGSGTYQFRVKMSR